MSDKKKKLGKGLGGLISGGYKVPVHATVEKTAKKSTPEEKPNVNSLVGFIEIHVDRIDANPRQHRKVFDTEEINALAESIRSEGLLQPILVREAKDRFELIAGERRLRAFRQLKIHKIPARVMQGVKDESSAVMSLVENVQRKDVNPIEEAFGYTILINDFKLKQDQVAQRVGKSREAIANALRLLRLEPEIQGYVATGRLSVGHAKVLLGLEVPEQRIMLARRIIETGMSVRAAESEVKRLAAFSGKAKAASGSQEHSENAIVSKLEDRIASYLNTRVSLKHGSNNKGKIVIEYFSNEDLTRIMEKFGLNLD